MFVAMLPEAERSKINFMAPSKWDEVKTALKASCASRASITTRLHEEFDEFIVERVHEGFVPKRLRLEYDALIPEIRWSCCDPNEQRGVIGFRLVSDSLVYVVNRKVTTLNEIAMVLTSCVTGNI